MLENAKSHLIMIRKANIIVSILMKVGNGED